MSDKDIPSIWEEGSLSPHLQSCLEAKGMWLEARVSETLGENVFFMCSLYPS